MLRKSIEIANIATRLMVGERLELFREREVEHIFYDSATMVKRFSLHKSSHIGEVVKIVNNMMNVGVGLSAYIWQHETRLFILVVNDNVVISEHRVR